MPANSDPENYMKKPQPTFKRSTALHGLTLEKILKEVQNKEEFLKGDRDH